jgi:hypothetical protein
MYGRRKQAWQGQFVGAFAAFFAVSTGKIRKIRCPGKTPLLD